MGMNWRRRWQVLDLVSLDAELAVDALAAGYGDMKLSPIHTCRWEELPPSAVVQQLDGRRRLIHQYLHALFMRDFRAGKEFHNTQVELYADYDREGLLAFLQHSVDYDINHAYSLCKSRGLYSEQVFLLGRMGNLKQVRSRNARRLLTARRRSTCWCVRCAMSLLLWTFVSATATRTCGETCCSRAWRTRT